MPEAPARPQKAAGLDSSEKSMAKLIDAAKNGDIAKVKACLDEGIDPDGPAKDGRTPLMAAVTGGHLAVIECLLAAFADPTLGKGEETPMTIAFQKGKQDILKVLFAATFSNLDSMTRAGSIPGMPDGIAEGITNEVPDNAMYELKNITQAIARVNMRPTSPEKTSKYGNYSGLIGSQEDAEDKDSDMIREQGVRLMMASLVKTNKEGGIGDVVKKPTSP